jgi:hypothetical protein
MKRLLVILALLSCTAVYAGPKKETSVDMTTMKDVFIGWVDISPDDWKALGYESEQAWSNVIVSNNQYFQDKCRKNLPGFQISGAKSKSEENASNQSLYVKFSEVKFDTGSYRLYLSIHFIDPKSGSEIASIPKQSFRGGHFSVNSCMQGALDKLADKLQDEIGKAKK